MQTLSHSEAETYTACERKHFYGYGLKLQPKGGTISDALYRGSLGHDGMAAYYQAIYEGSKFPLQAAHQAVIAGVNISGREDTTIMAQVIAILQKYHEYWSDRDADLEVVEVESSRLYEINPGLQTQIRPDLIVRRPGQGLSVWDHKWMFNFMTQHSLDILPQLPKYYTGLMEAGLNITSARYNQIRYRDLKPDARLTKEQNLERLFRRDEVPLSKTRRNQTMEEHAKIARRIKHWRDLPVGEWDHGIVRTANVGSCKICAFQTLCSNDLNGRDRELMIKELYETKAKRILVESLEG